MSAEQEDHNEFLRSSSLPCFVIGDDERSSASSDHVDCPMIDQPDESEAPRAKPSPAFSAYQEPGGLQARKRFDLLRNSQELSKTVLEQHKQQRHFQWETNKRLQSIEDAQRTYHQQTIEDLHVVVNTIAAADKRIFEEVQLSASLMQDVHNRQRDSLASMAAEFKNMKAEIQKLEKGETQSDCSPLAVVADQVKDLASTVHKLSIDAPKGKGKEPEEKSREPQASGSTAAKRHQLMERLNDQVSHVESLALCVLSWTH